jgi:hypothetical protein
MLTPSAIDSHVPDLSLAASASKTTPFFSLATSTDSSSLIFLKVSHVVVRAQLASSGIIVTVISPNFGQRKEIMINWAITITD